MLIRGKGLSSCLFPDFIFLYKQYPRANTVRKVTTAMVNKTEFAVEWMLVTGPFVRSMGGDYE